MTCPGPVYFLDQGIEFCETCDGCICCDYEHVDHLSAERECVRNVEGRCVLIAHGERPCTEFSAEEQF